MTEVTPRPAPVVRDVVLRWTIGVDYLFANFGRFSLMPVLAIMLARRSGNGDALTTGFGLFGFMVVIGLSALVVGRHLVRYRYAVTMPASMLCSALGFGLQIVITPPLPTLALLFLGGFGISVHAVLVRVLVAETIASEPARNNIYSIQQIMTNAAAALGPFIAGALYVSGNAAPLLAFISVSYLLAGVALVIGLPWSLWPPRAAAQRAGGSLTGLRVIRDRECLHASVVTAVGSFVYGQFYSAFALLVALGIGSAFLRGALLAGPPVAIVVFQTLVTAMANRWLRGGVTPLRILIISVLVFGGAVALLGIGLPVVLGSVVAMTIWAVGEMLFTPTVSIAFSRITTVSRLAASNVQGVAWTAGESLGSLCGGAVFLFCYQHGAGSAYWLVLAVLAIGVVLPYLRAGRSAPDVVAPAAEPSLKPTR